MALATVQTSKKLAAMPAGKLVWERTISWIRACQSLGIMRLIYEQRGSLKLSARNIAPFDNAAERQLLSAWSSNVLIRRAIRTRARSANAFQRPIEITDQPPELARLLLHRAGFLNERWVMSLSDTSSSWLQAFRKLFELAYGDQIVLEYESCRMRGAPMTTYPVQAKVGMSDTSTGNSHH